MLHISLFLERKPFDLQTFAIFSKSADQLEQAFIQTEGWPRFGDSGAIICCSCCFCALKAKLQIRGFQRPQWKLLFGSV